MAAPPSLSAGWDGGSEAGCSTFGRKRHRRHKVAALPPFMLGWWRRPGERWRGDFADEEAPWNGCTAVRHRCGGYVLKVLR